MEMRRMTNHYLYKDNGTNNFFTSPKGKDAAKNWVIISGEKGRAMIPDNAPVMTLQYIEDAPEGVSVILHHNVTDKPIGIISRNSEYLHFGKTNGGLDLYGKNPNWRKS
jgi:hypothetical protein